MGEILGVFERLNNDLKLKLSLIIFGLFMPSLIYYVLLFTDGFLKIDILKTIIICVCINFVFIVSFTFIGMLYKNFIKACRETFIYNCRLKLSIESDKLKISLSEMSEKSSEVKKITNTWNDYLKRYEIIFANYTDFQENAKINENQIRKEIEELVLEFEEVKKDISEAEKLSGQVDKGIEENDKVIKEYEEKSNFLIKYIEGFTDISIQLATSSVFYAVLTIYLIIYKLYNANNLELNLDILLREGLIFHIIYIVVIFLKILIDDIRAVEKIKNYFND